MLGKVKILTKKLMKRQITFIGGLGTSRRNRLFSKSMRYSTIEKHTSFFAVVVRSSPVPVQLKQSFYKLFQFWLKDFPRVFGRVKSRDIILRKFDR